MLPQGVREFPFDLPDNFIASMGCPSPHQYVALFWRNGDLCYNDGAEGTVELDEWQANDFFEQTFIESWLLDREEINFGYHGIATHWLVIDTGANEAIIAEIAVARKIVSEQILE